LSYASRKELRKTICFETQPLQQKALPQTQGLQNPNFS